MQTSNLSANRIHGHEEEVVVEPPAKRVATIEEDENTDYQSLPSRPSKRQTTPPPTTKTHSPNKPANVHISASSTDAPATTSDALLEESASQAAISAQNATTAADDDDWLRNRTNRLLDLADENDDISAVLPAATSSTKTTTTITNRHDVRPVASVKVDAMEVDTAPVPKETPEMTRESEDAIIEAVRKTRRIFCRNLPYTATAEDLRTHFEKFGEVEEVRIHFLRQRLRFCDEPQIGTAELCDANPGPVF